MSTFVVITSIFAPTEAVMAFGRMRDVRTIVVGDRKSPADFACEGVEFLSLSSQQQGPYALGGLLPVDHYCRKMMGYLAAAEQGATEIIDTDDDNIPKENYGFPTRAGRFPTLPDETGFINVYQLYTKARIWPRGLPLRLVLSQTASRLAATERTCSVGIWQGLVDEDPDVDAIYRLTDGSPCIFDRRGPIVLGLRTASPFNSQNTCFSSAAFPLLYLPTTVTFRFTDILRSLVAQPVMWASGLRLGFVDANVIQRRNPHDFTKDFESEVPMHLHGERAYQLCLDVVREDASIEDNLRNCYRALTRAEIVEDGELASLEAWLTDLQRAEANRERVRPG